MRTRKSNPISIAVAMIFALYLFYYSYRYVFRYNSEDTSPTYSATPFALQLAKYVLLAILCLLILFYFFLNDYKLSPKPTILFLCLMLFLLQNIYSLIVCKSVNNVISLLCLFPAFLLICGSCSIQLSSIDKVFRVFLNFTIVYELIQIILYLSIGRLPALAYDTGVLTDVRFGGAWDDPNGFSILLSFFIPYVFYAFHGIKRVAYLLILMLFLLLTWSMTGIAATVGVVLILGIIKLFRSPKRYTRKSIGIFVSVTFFTIAVCAVIGYVYQDEMIYFVNSKLGSVQGHLAGWNLQGISLETILGISPIAFRPESSVISLICHGGILHMLLFYLLGVMGIYYAYRAIGRLDKTNEFYPFQVGSFVYLIVFLVASINLPFVYSLPNLGVFALFLAISTLKANQSEKLIERSA